jgi:hypothetical protein
MPTPDATDNPNDWQTQLMNYLRGTGGPPVMPNFGATMPNDPLTQDQALPGGRSAWPAVTPGAPSMGYPALNPGGNPRAWPPTGPAPAAPAPGSSPAATTTAPPAAPRSVAPAPVVHTPGAPNLGYYPPNPRFGTMQSQVPSGRGPLGNNPIYTTMNLFGGGQQPAAASAAAAPAAQGAAVPRTYPGEGWDVDAQGNPIPSYGNPLADPTQTNPTALASAVSQPNWWQKLGRPDMNPNQLASAVRKPNWWQNV